MPPDYNELLDNSACRFKDNLREVTNMLAIEELHLIFFLNLEMDFNVGSLDEAWITEFFNNYSEIPISAPTETIFKDFVSQLKTLFSSRRLSSNITFTPTEPHVNILDSYTFWREHYGYDEGINYDLFYHDYGRHEFALDDPTIMRVPFRSSGGSVRNIWLAKQDEVAKHISSYPGYPGTKATAINDGFGLGMREKKVRGGDHDALLLMVSFPSDFDNLCFKPTFIDGPLGSAPELTDNFFLNSKIVDGGYGRTKSTHRGTYEIRECLTAALPSLTPDFSFEFLGYAEQRVDRSNLLDQAKLRYRESK